MLNVELSSQKQRHKKWKKEKRIKNTLVQLLFNCGGAVAPRLIFDPFPWMALLWSFLDGILTSRRNVLCLLCYMLCPALLNVDLSLANDHHHRPHATNIVICLDLHSWRCGTKYFNPKVDVLLSRIAIWNVKPRFVVASPSLRWIKYSNGVKIYNP